MAESDLSTEVNATTVLPAASGVSATTSNVDVDVSWTNTDDSPDGGMDVKRETETYAAIESNGILSSFSSPVLPSTSTFTITYRVDTTGVASDGNSYGVIRADGDNNDTLLANRVGSGASFYLRTDEGSNSGYIGGLGSVPDEPYLVALWWDGTETRTYINGVQQASTSFSPSETFGPASISVGHTIGTNITPYEDVIDDIRIFDRALSDSEIQSLADGESIENGLLGWWPLNEGSGTTVKDASGASSAASVDSGINWVSALEQDGAPKLQNQTTVATGIEPEFAAQFDASSAYVQTDSPLNYTSGATTVLVRLNPTTSDPDYQDGTSRRTVFNDDVFELDQKSNDNVSIIIDGGTSLGDVNDGTYSYPSGETQLMGFRTDGTTVEMLRDTEVLDSATISNFSAPSIPAELGRDTGQDRYWAGKVDEVMVWDRRLSDNEVQSVVGRSLPSSGLVQHFDFANRSGTVTDRSGSGVDGTAFNVNYTQPTYPYRVTDTSVAEDTTYEYRIERNTDHATATSNATTVDTPYPIKVNGNYVFTLTVNGKDVTGIELNGSQVL